MLRVSVPEPPVSASPAVKVAVLAIASEANVSVPTKVSAPEVPVNAEPVSALVVSEPVKQLQNPSRLNELQLDFSPQLVPTHTRPNWSQERLPRCFQFPMGYGRTATTAS